MKTTVQRAYLIEGNQAQRVIADSHGRVFLPEAKAWGHSDGRVVTIPGTFERWVDVPAAWLGLVPWWQ